MDLLIKWLTMNSDQLKREDEKVVICHGDFKMDNVIFDPNSLKILAVLDWELSSIGRPMSDLAYSLIFYNFSSENNLFGSPQKAIGLPSKDECLGFYFEGEMGKKPGNFYAFEAFSIFRIASILQGVYKRHLQGNASSEQAKEKGLLAREFAKTAWEIICSNDSSQNSSLNLSGNFSLTNMFPVSEEAKCVLKDLELFLRLEVFPLEKTINDFYSEISNSYKAHPCIEPLKAKAKEKGLWNLFLTKNHGGRFTNLEYSFMAEKMGAFPFASYFFNCSAPDTGNMELLTMFATKEQKENYLNPLLEGQIRSCFAMTEPAVASSDPTNLQTTITKMENGNFRVNGRKWWISGAGDPLCKFAIVMGKIGGTTDSNSLPLHSSHSMIIVPFSSPGVKIIRPMTVFGYADGPSCHCEIEFNEVEVPAANLLGKEGQAFALAQARLGPGRLHHCMRLIGMAEKAIEITKSRMKTRKAFGRLLSQNQVVQAKLAECRLKVDQARLFVLFTAEKIDKVGVKESRKEISGIKIVIPRMACEVIDEAIQIHGAAGLSQDSTLPGLYAAARTLRIADGPDDVHIRTLGRLEMK